MRKLLLRFIVMTAFASALVLAVAISGTAQADVLNVTNANDSGAGSLRQAIFDAMTSDEIVFDPSIDGIPIVLTSGELWVDKDLTITGRGQDNTILDGDANSFQRTRFVLLFARI
jgi:hypothetical protein